MAIEVISDVENEVQLDQTIQSVPDSGDPDPLTLLRAAVYQPRALEAVRFQPCPSKKTVLGKLSESIQEQLAQNVAQFLEEADRANARYNYSTRQILAQIDSSNPQFSNWQSKLYWEARLFLQSEAGLAPGASSVAIRAAYRRAVDLIINPRFQEDSAGLLDPDTVDAALRPASLFKYHDPVSIAFKKNPSVKRLPAEVRRQVGSRMMYVLSLMEELVALGAKKKVENLLPLIDHQTIHLDRQFLTEITNYFTEYTDNPEKVGKEIFKIISDAYKTHLTLQRRLNDPRYRDYDEDLSEEDPNT